MEDTTECLLMERRLVKALFALIFGILWCLPAQAQQDDGTTRRKLAFVVGISQYDNLDADSQLKAPVRDADEVAKRLIKLGFEVVGGVQANLKRDDFKAQWADFIRLVSKGSQDTVFVYLAGHGMQIEDQAFFLPRNIPFKKAARPRELEDDAIRLAGLIQDLENAHTRLVLFIVDACRNNPFVQPEYQDVDNLGGASITATGMLVLFSASKNELAYDTVPNSSNPHSLFAQALLTSLDRLATEEMPVHYAWTGLVREEVKKLADSAKVKQTSRAYSGLEGEYCLLGQCRVPSRTAGKLVPVAPPDIPVSGSFDPCTGLEAALGSTDERLLLAIAPMVRSLSCAEAVAWRVEQLKRARSTLRVLSIGAGEHDASSGYPNLRTSSSDAQNVAVGLRQWAGSSYHDVRPAILNGNAATRQNILDEIARLQRSTTPSDVTMIFVSGATTSLGGKAYLVPFDGGPGADSLIGLDAFRAQIAKMPGRRIVFLDLCGSELGNPLETLLDNGARDAITIYTSASPGEAAMDASSFANAIVRGLAGDAVAADGVSVTIDSLGAYVAGRIRQEVGSRQRPTLITDNGGYVLWRGAKPSGTSAALILEPNRAAAN